MIMVLMGEGVYTDSWKMTSFQSAPHQTIEYLCLHNEDISIPPYRYLGTGVSYDSRTAFKGGQRVLVSLDVHGSGQF